MINKHLLKVIILISMLLSFSFPAQAYIVTFYPDLDGSVWQYRSQGYDWSGVRDGAGVGANDTGLEAGVGVQAHPTDYIWRSAARTIFVFDTAVLPDDAEITGVKLYLYTSDYLGGKYAESHKTDANVYSASPASDTALAAGDYDSLGTTAFSTTISYDDWATTGNVNEFIFNSNGIAAISTTGITRLGLRDATYDAADNEPTHPLAGVIKSNAVRAYFSEAGEEYSPKLIVNYSLEGEGVIPEPASLLLLGFGVVGVTFFRNNLSRRRQN